MPDLSRPAIVRWDASAIASIAAVLLAQAALAVAPLFLPEGVTERLTVLFIYGIMALMWNALAGYAGLVSVGQQMFFGLGAYGAIRLADAGMAPYASLLASSLAVGLVAMAISLFMLRLKDGEFAIGMWVLAELTRALVNLDPLIQGETGTSLISMQQYAPEPRRLYTYWAALAVMALLAWLVYGLLRGRIGSAAQAIRDNEQAAASVGVRVTAAKRLIFVLSAFGGAVAGALWLATTISFQPKSYFSVQWASFMIFMVLVGGIGTYEGPILGAVIFFLIETFFGDQGVAYLIGLGVVAVLFALLLPKGIWGWIEQRFGWRVLPIGARLRGQTRKR
jgi:branched-chain amino acid transport system permease protein